MECNLNNFQELLKQSFNNIRVERQSSYFGLTSALITLTH